MRVVVTVDDAHQPKIKAVARALSKAGLKTSSVMAVAGVITGSVAEAKIPALKQVAGVVAVEPDSEMRAI